MTPRVERRPPAAVQTPAPAATANSDYARIERAIAYLQTHAERQPDLASLAAYLGLSEFHVHRLFHRWAGVTPKEFLQVLTLGRAKRLLSEDAQSVLTTSLEAGLSGPGRLHDLFLGLEAMTPGEYKRAGEGLVISWGIHPTPLGDTLVALTPRGVCAVSFLDHGDGPLPGPVPVGLESAPETLRARWPAAEFRAEPARTGPVAAEISARLRGAGPRQTLHLVLRGTPFQVKVWEALLAIREGALVSYGQLASRVGAPGAGRAVGTAVGANPVGYLIPCHRVIRATGLAGDYRWGARRKAVLLALEASRAAGRARAA